jgi:hypothetical protein
MSKVLKKSDLAEQPAIRTLLAVSLCASIAAFGCTTDRTLGDGDPVVTPGLRTSPTGGTSAGSENESVPPPMMSSYSGTQPLPAVRPRISREEAALLVTEMQPRVRVLGTVAPGDSGRPYVSDQPGLGLAPTIPARSTVNSSIYSGPNAVVSSGAGGAVGGTDASALFVDTATVDAGNVATGVTSSASVAGSSVTNGGTVNVTNPGGAVIAPTTAATGAPTANSFVAPPAFASVRTLSPTAAAVVNPPASVSGSPAVASVSSARTAGTVARSSTVTAGTTQAATTQQSVSGTTSAAVANPVRVVTTNGRVTVTNVDRQQ